MKYKNYRFSFANKLTFLGVFAISGIVLLLSTFASVPASHFEAENSNFNGSISAKSDDAASAGSYAQFGHDISLNPAKLKWSPPTLENPITINLGSGKTSTTLDDSRDYIINFPPGKKVGATLLKGGRNVVIKGGYITIPTGTSNDSERRAIYIVDQAGTQEGRTVHIEGVLIDGSGGGDSDGIVANADKTILQVQNSRIVNLTGSYAGFHNDVIQPWGGLKELRVDRLTGSSNYQGLQIQADLGPIERADLSNIDLTYNSVGVQDGGYLAWFTNGSCSNAFPITLDEVYLTPKSGRSLGKSVWPDVDNSTCPPTISGGRASWPSLPISGYITEGSLSNGDFVPEGVAGLNYDSPGYQ